MSTIDDATAGSILMHLNEVARTVNETYDAVNTRSSSVEEVRARVAVMRAQLERLEARMVTGKLVIQK